MRETRDRGIRQMSCQNGKSEVTLQDSVKELIEKAMCFLQDGDMGAVVDCLVLAISIIEDDSFPEVN